MKNFIEKLSSKSSTPGGGAASSVYGEIGCALGSMVCALSEENKKCYQHKDFIKNKHKEILDLQKKFNYMIKEDIEAFNLISQAYKLPNKTQEEQAYRSNMIQEALVPATESPFKIMLLSTKAIDIIKALIDITNKQVISDLGCAVLGLKAAMLSAYLNVCINLKSLNKPLTEIENKTNKIMQKYPQLADKIYKDVINALK